MAMIYNDVLAKSARRKNEQYEMARAMKQFIKTYIY